MQDVTNVLGAEINTPAANDPAHPSNQPSADDAIKAIIDKYGSVEELAKAKLHADTFIETLKTEKHQLQQTYEQKVAEAKTVEEILAAIESGGSKGYEEQPTPTPNTQPNLDPAELDKRLEQLLEKRKLEEKIKHNQEEAWKKLGEVFGSDDAAKQAIADYIGSDPIKKDVVEKLGSFDPEGLVEYMKTQKKKPEGFSPDLNAINRPAPTSGLTWKKVQEIKKANPSLYNSRQFQVQIHQAAAANPNFWD